MATAIERACADEVSIAAKYLAAAKAAGFESLISLIALDVDGMTASIPTDAAVAKLLKLMIEKDGTLKIDNDVDLRVARLIAFHVAAAHKNSSAPAAAPAAAAPAAATSNAAAEKLAAEAFGTAAYASYEEKTLDVVPPKYRAPGKDIKQVVDDLNRGTLRKEAWQLHLQKNLLSTDEEKTSALTADIALTLSAPVSAVDLAGYAEVLTQLEIFTLKMGAACLREVEPHASNPHAVARKARSVASPCPTLPPAQPRKRSLPSTACRA